MKKTIVIAIVLLSQTIAAQKYYTRTGITHFKASVEAFEPVEAINKSSTAIIKSSTGDIAIQLFITAFKFDVALMQEHFNENYMDSDRFPKAMFRGKIDGFYLEKLTSEKEYPLKGVLTVRGIKKEINTTVLICLKNNKINLIANFSVQPQDFDIKIPSIVRKKIAEHINVSINYELVEKK
ncbi:YceI family protein [Tenacibaculum sp.]|nr:YceI family protein [Tenacibaculum sp.]